MGISKGASFMELISLYVLFLLVYDYFITFCFFVFLLILDDIYGYNFYLLHGTFFLVNVSHLLLVFPVSSFPYNSFV